MDQFISSLRQLKSSPWELYIIFISNILVSFQFYMLTTLTPIYFTGALNTGDTEAGLIFGCLGIVIGVLSICFGSVVDRVGIKVALVVSSIFSTLGFAVQSISEDLVLSISALLLFQTVGTSLAWPVVELGVKQYSEKANWNTNNSIVIISNYSSGIVAGLYIDSAWNTDAPQSENFRYIYAFTGLIGIVSILLSTTLLLCSKKKQEHETEEFHEEGILLNTKFWRFFAFILLLVLLRSGCFGHLDATLPKYLLRNNGNSTFGTYLALHSLSMLVGTLGFTPLSFVVSSYTLILIGGTMGTLAPFLLVSDLPYKIGLFTVLLSLGESLWVPRLLDYTMKISSEHHEGIYLALCNCPFYFGMIITGYMSGILLETYCAKGGEGNDCDQIWLIIGLSGIAIPVLLFVLRPVLEEPQRSVLLQKVDLREQGNL